MEVYEEFCIIDFDHFPEFSVRTVTLLRGPEIIGRRPYLVSPHDARRGAILPSHPFVMVFAYALLRFSAAFRRSARVMRLKVCFTSQAACRNRIARDARFWNLHHSTR